MTSAADKLLSIAISDQLNILRGEAAVKREIARIMRRLGVNLAEVVIGIDARGETFVRVFSAGAKPKVRKAVQQIESLIDTERKAAYLAMGQAARTEIMAAVPGVLEVLKGPGAATFGPRKYEALLTAAMSNRVLGNQPNAWWNKLGADLLQRLVVSVADGVSRGEGVAEVVRRIRGRRENGFRDGVVQISTRNAETLARTMMLSAANQGRMDSLRDLQPVVKGVRWVSTLDLRTSQICRGLDGAQWMSISSGGYRAYPGAPPWRGPPPAHPNCRSTVVPIIASYAELAEDPKIREKLLRARRVTERTRASMNGQVPANLTYDDWLRLQPEAVQRQVLGNTKWRLWQEGGLSMRDMISQDHRPLRISELLSKARKINPPTLSVSAVPGVGRKFGFPAGTSPEVIQAYHDRVLERITTDQGKIKVLQRLGIDHDVVRTMGVFEGNREPSFEIRLAAGTSMADAKRAAALLGDGLLQDVVYVSRPDFQGAHMGVRLRKLDGGIFTSADLDRISNQAAEAGLGMSGSRTTVTFLDDAFFAQDKYTETDFRQFIQRLQTTYGDQYGYTAFATQSEAIGSYGESYATVNAKTWDRFSREGRSHLQRAVDDFYEAVWGTYTEEARRLKIDIPATRPTPLGEIATRTGPIGGDVAAGGVGRTAPGQLVVRHYSYQPGLTETDPAFHGTGLKGAKRRRRLNDRANYQDRTYFGTSEYRPEPGLGPHAYEAVLEESRLYDYRRDPDRLAVRLPGGGVDATRTERAIREAGYSGYRVGEVIAVFDKVKVRRVK
jgi:SPP1 gp7 family putative phage head morphogenesis protein